MSQAPNPFTQAASQGYGDFTSTLDDEDQDENNVVDEEEEEDQQQQLEDDEEEEELEGPQSPEPEEQEINELGFTQTQERSYPTGIESPDEDENEGQNEMSDNEQEQEREQDDNNEEVEPSSPQIDDSNEQQEVEEENEKNNDDNEEDHDTNQKQSQLQQRRRVQIMDDSDNEEEQPIESTSVVSKDRNRHFLKQFTMKNDDSHKKHKKRHSDEHQHRHDHKSKRFRKTSNDDDDDNNNTEEPQEKNTDIVEATSDVEDVVDDIFGKDVNDNEEEGNDQEEVAAELAELNDDNEVVQEEGGEEEEDEQQQTFDTEEGEDEEISAHKSNYSTSKNNIGYDIDLYLEKRAEKRRGNRRRGGKNGDIDLAGPDGDQLVSKLIDQMKIATEEDRIFNKSRQPATAKLLLLPTVEQQLCRADLTEIFLDNGILTVFKDWLSPLPDKSLPNIKIRESLIKILQQFGVINADPLRDSGIGKALMYLYKHPRETKENKIKLIKIIHDWARPIFNLDTDYKLLTREERQQRDVDQASLKRQTSLTGKPKNRSADVDLPFSSDRRQDDDDELNKDEDCPRARVPRPSNKDYVVRPVSTVEYSDKKGDGKKRTISRLDAIKRRQQDRKRNSKPMSIVKLSIEGNKMHL
ncbi:unnamed protein product [Rotaria sordida]|uniref:TFIIS N-terminal domain-containing protein n=1 Tax=Rotaria sordida TaxID=392033 RepID=A0A815CF66_9BILA|nr:unnamed protein product [Rotaria sordida]